MSETMRFSVDDDASVAKVKSSLPLPGLSDVSVKVIELGADAVCSAMSATLKNIFTMIDGLPLESETHEINDIRFKLLVDARGEVSVFSAAKGSLSGQSGLEFTITRKR